MAFPPWSPSFERGGVKKEVATADGGGAVCGCVGGWVGVCVCVYVHACVSKNISRGVY
jgi:hypothetical protein